MTELTPKEKQFLLNLARQTIEVYLLTGQKIQISPDKLPPVSLKEKKATFVTLTKADQLRGCIGALEAIRPLYLDIIENAWAAAFADPRFTPISSKEELDQCKIEISILTMPQPIKNYHEIKPGVDGVILDYYNQQATFLPQVWLQLPEKNNFLNHLACKAGLEQTAWQNPDCHFEIYQVQNFSDSD